jgi:uncharacterized cupin superfamily protein
METPMPSHLSQSEPPSSNTQSSVRVINIDSDSIQWEDYGDLPGDLTPGNPPGRHATVYESPDKRVTVGVWTRDADIGVLLGSEQSFDFVIEGEVTVTDQDGAVHVARSGDLLIYTNGDSGTWHQPGPIKKIFIHVRD